MRHHVISVFGPFAASAAEAPPPFLWPPKECPLGHSVPFLLEAPRTAPASAQPPPPHLPPLPEPLLDRDHVPPVGVLEGAPAMEPQGPPVLGQVRTPSEAPASPRARLAGSVGESQIVPCTRRPSFRGRRGTEPLPFRGRLALLLCPTSAGAISTLPLSPARAYLGAGGGRYLGAVCLPLLGTQALLRAEVSQLSEDACITGTGLLPQPWSTSHGSDRWSCPLRPPRGALWGAAAGQREQGGPFTSPICLFQRAHGACGITAPSLVGHQATSPGS